MLRGRLNLAIAGVICERERMKFRRAPECCKQQFSPWRA
jgi:hypothetical protein